MNHQDVLSRVSDYLDGSLSPRECGELENHLEACGLCREEVDALRSLLTEAAGLPRELEPPRDLWPKVEGNLGAQITRIEAPSPGLWKHLLDHGLREGLAAAAAVALLITGVLLDPGSRGDVGTARAERDPLQEPGTAMLANLVWGMETESQVTGKALVTAMHHSSNPMTAQSVQGIGSSLRALDRAIEESSVALRENPENPVLLKRLSRYYRQRLSLLSSATHLAARS